MKKFISTQGLNERFRLFQNLVTNRGLLPSSVVEIVCFVSATVLLVVIKEKYDPMLNNEMSIYLLNVNYQLYSLYHMIHPLAYVRFNRILEKQVRRKYPRLCLLFGMKIVKSNKIGNVELGNVNCDIVDYRHDPESMFDRLEKIWNSSSPV